ncbi:sulfite exporter TauE/SafE family protein [Alginatibacterium sediminis]|uniref:Probable membrane transporter protein n=1 Tax=Alginatibacterium sediminis TaxID=2164068 RepID=A0A420E5W0_9ALTE|nr:sulfite exporter TauE/SafE family protein [Alginatibacterium sediminis]RKF12771.1 sulfite exporter TauE/SafE family protein [Alginatibacterium sediminis]
MDNSILVLHVAAMLSGISKFSVGGMGALILPLLLLAFPGQQALAILIPMFLVADLLTMVCYRKNINWKVLLRLLALMAVGCVLGAVLMNSINTHQFARIIGLTILGMLLLSIYLEYNQTQIRTSSLAQSSSGIFAGFISMTANSAGPIMSLYLLEEKLGKPSYVSTRAWLAGMVNIIKIPLLVSIGALNTQTALLSLSALPSLLLGAWLGYKLLKRISFTQLTWSVRCLIVLAAGSLLLN